MNIQEALTKLFEKDKMAIRAILCEFEEDYDVVDELMQETFLKAWDKRDQFDEKSKLLTWVCTIAKNVARDYIKAKRGEPDMVSEDQARPVEGGTYTDTLAAARPEDDPAAALEAQDILREACTRMPVQVAQAVRLRLEGYSNPEIAEILETSVSTIENAISKSREYFSS